MIYLRSAIGLPLYVVGGTFIGIGMVFVGLGQVIWGDDSTETNRER